MMTVSDPTNPVYASPDGKVITCEVTLSGLPGRHGYNAADGDALSQQLYDELSAGVYGAVAPFVPTDPPPETVAKKPEEAQSKNDHADQDQNRR